MTNTNLIITFSCKHLKFKINIDRLHLHMNVNQNKADKLTTNHTSHSGVVLHRDVQYDLQSPLSGQT